MQRIFHLIGGVIGILVGITIGCTDSRDTEDWCLWDSVAIVKERRIKDQWMKNSPDSPIPNRVRAAFSGLSYYPPVQDFVVLARLEVFDRPDTVQLLTTISNDVRTMIRFGQLHFMLNGQNCQLTVYRYVGVMGKQYPDLLFVPFKDPTNGVETYDGGRYLDLHYRSGQYQLCLDFNRAYNPYCAYNSAYSCPLVPEENVLSVEIRAGERQWSGRSLQ